MNANFDQFAGYVKDVFIPDRFDLVALGAEYCKPATGRDKVIVATMTGFIDEVVQKGLQDKFDLDIRCPQDTLRIWLTPTDPHYGGNKLQLDVKRGLVQVPHAGLLLPSYNANLTYHVRGNPVPMRPMQDEPFRNCGGWEMPEAQLNHARFYLGLPRESLPENAVVRIPTVSVVAAADNPMMDA